MKLAIQADFPPSGQIAFFAGIDQANRRLGSPHQILPFSLPPETLIRRSELMSQVDAYVGSLLSYDWIPSDLVRTKRWIDIAQWSHLREIPSIGVDYHEIGLRGAEALERSGVERIIIPAAAGQERTHHVVAGAREASGLPVSAVPLLTRERLRTWLPKLPTQTGILTLSDTLARMMIEQIRLAGSGIGSDFRVIGVGDEPEASLLAGIEIASFPVPYNAIGQAVVESLETVKPHTRLLKPGPLKPRSSLTGVQEAKDLVTRITKWMERNLQAENSIAAVAERFGLSRRSLELRFRQKGLPGPNRHWNALRLAKAETLLRQTDLRMVEIAELCGYSSQSRFTQAFSRHSGKTPTAFRIG